tara:strand:- start:8660 stop:8905 length:246 start_codon:yes stop_codon:yes gene_type:complete
LKDLTKQLEKSINEKVQKLEASFNKDFNKWINLYIEKNNFDSGLLDVTQNNKNRFAEIYYKSELVAYVTISNNELKFHELI